MSLASSNFLGIATVLRGSIPSPLDHWWSLVLGGPPVILSSNIWQWTILQWLRWFPILPRYHSCYSCYSCGGLSRYPKWYPNWAEKCWEMPRISGLQSCLHWILDLAPHPRVHPWTLAALAAFVSSLGDVLMRRWRTVNNGEMMHHSSRRNKELMFTNFDEKKQNMKRNE